MCILHAKKMDSLLVLSLLLLLTSFPALISVNAAGVQTSKPLRFLYSNNEFEFGPLKVKVLFNEETEFTCSYVRVFLGYFISTFDVQTASGEISDDSFAKKLDSTAKELMDLFQKHPVHPFVFQMFLNTENLNFIQKNHQSIKSYLMSVKTSLSEMASSLICVCVKGVCKFQGAAPSQGETYTDLLIMYTFMTLTEIPASWRSTVVKKCYTSTKCLADAIRNTRPKKEIENSKDSNLNGNNEGNTAIRGSQTGPSFVSFLFYITAFFICSYIFLR
ncbi:hypothetical protein HMI56_002378 [Coelomomyces lativittatus]|nr:hypothetical protein HMI56_002378 [Coelomomyces lativittatus]